MGRYYGLNAKTEEEFNANLENLVKAIKKNKHKLSNIKDFDDFFSFISAFKNDADYRNPIWIDEEKIVTSAEIDLLRSHNYPEDYIEWCQKYGQYSIGLGIQLSSVSDVLDNISEEYYALQVKNKYLYFATDGSGNDFAFDTADNGKQIRIFYHDAAITSESIPDIYSEFYYFYFNDETNEYENPEELDISLIFDEKGEYIQDSVYIKDYLKTEEASKIAGNKGFLSFLIENTIEGLDAVVNYYCYDIENLALSYQERGNLDHAFSLYDTTIEANTQKALAYNNRAYKLRTAGFTEKSMEYIDKALELEPEVGLYHATKAEILFDMGSEERFFQSLELALKFGMDKSLIDNAMIEKYKNDSRFNGILSRY